jgi:murein DD-endopeptidase MepM/ murein hydrolase activator NlpD
VALAVLSGCAHQSTPRESRMIELSVNDCARLDWPVAAPLTSPFGRRDGRPHEGIDLSAPDGTAVHAACDGVVVYAGSKLAGYGRLVILSHAGERATVYAHNQALLIHLGQAVTRGQVIARSGHSGRVTAPHVHFELRVGTPPRAIDPLPWLVAPPPALADLRR